MNCSQVTELLTEYADNRLDPATRIDLEQHLAHCQACSAEWAALRAYFEAMDSLPRVRAPADFLASVHARLEQPGWFKRLLSWLFIPMKLKLPFEAAGLIAASLLVVLLYRGTEPEKSQLAPIPPAPPVQAPTASAPPRATAPASPEPLLSTPSHSSPEQSSPASHPLSASRPAPQAPPRAIPKPVELVLQLNPAADRLTTAPTAQRPQLPAATTSTTALQAEEQVSARKVAPMPPSATGKTESTGPSSPAATLSRIRELVEKLDGAILPVNDGSNTQLPQVVTAEIPARSYDSLVAELDHLGRLEKPAAGPKVPDQAGLILLQIRLVPPR